MIYETILTSTFNLAELKNEIKKFILWSDIDNCWNVDDVLDEYFKVHSDLEAKNKELYNELKLLQKECEWIALKTINQGKVLNCFNNINIAWEIPKKYSYPIVDNEPFFWQTEIISKNLERFLINIILLEDRDKFKNLLMESLKSSEEIFSKSRIVANNASLMPTLSNWFNEYFNEVGTGALNKLRMAKFFSENKNFQKTSYEEKNKIKLIFNIYELIKLTSRNPKGLEERISIKDRRGIGYIKHGEIVHYSQKEIEKSYKALSDTEDLLIDNGLQDKKIFTKDKLNDFLQKNNNEIKKEQKKIKQINDNKPMISDIPQYKPTAKPAGLKHDVFGEEDAKEIEKHKYSGLKKDKSIDINNVIAELKEKMALIFSEPEMEVRFNNLVSSYLKGIRDEMEFSGMLTQPIASGGLDYKIIMAEKIIDYLKQYRSVGTLHATSIPTPSIQSTPKYVRPIPKINAAPTFKQAQNIMKSSAVKAAVPMYKPPMPVKKADPAPMPPKPVYMPSLKRMESAKPVIQDIKKPIKDVRLIGPIEELNAITLVKFRRLADTPVEAVERIKEKIDLLEEQSISVKAKGIVAFKNSPLNKIYLKIGNSSIDQGRSVAEIISELSQKGEEYLTKEEFDCIADLNKKLRF